MMNRGTNILNTLYIAYQSSWRGRTNPSLLAMTCLLITFAQFGACRFYIYIERPCLDPDQVRQYGRPDLDSNCLHSDVIFSLKNLTEKNIFLSQEIAQTCVIMSDLSTNL